MALGALATAATFVLVLINQKGTQKQIDSLSQMAEMFSRHYQLERIQAGSNIYPKIQISLKDDLMWGLKIQVKNNSYPVEVYRIIIYEPRTHLDIKLKPKSEYIQVRQGETKCILPGELSRQSLYAFGASIRIYLITPFEEAYEIRYMAQTIKIAISLSQFLYYIPKMSMNLQKRKLLKSNNIRYMEAFREP